VRARQTERKTGADLVDLAVRDARRVCMDTSNSKASTTAVQDNVHASMLCRTGRGNMARNAHI